MRITIPSLIPPNVTINLAMSALATVNEKRPAPKALIMGISDCDPIQNLSREKTTRLSRRGVGGRSLIQTKVGETNSEFGSSGEHTGEEKFSTTN